jgi:hypothetical protein
MQPNALLLRLNFDSQKVSVIEPTQERGDGCRPSHSLLHRWLEFCDEILRKSTTGGGGPTDRAHDGGIGTHSGDVVFLH